VYRCPVRYNGKAFDGLAGLGRERSDYVFTPVCPECLAGFGVPREPVHLTGPGSEVIAGSASVRNRHGRDVSGQLIAGARSAMDALVRADVQAVIVKESSPSCGLAKAQVGRRRRAETGAGVFGAMLLESGWFLIPDEALASPVKWWDWRRRMHAWLWLKDRPIASARDLYDAWHVLKFVVQEIDRPLADRIGRDLAALPKAPPTGRLEEIRSEVLEALRRPSTLPRIRQAMWKTYVHAKKKGQLDGVDLHELTVSSPEVIANSTTIARELTLMERVSFENDLLFGTSPVLARDERRVRQRDTSTD
jgi:uncharacterized protein YbbK (DUF523 family)